MNTGEFGDGTSIQLESAVKKLRVIDVLDLERAGHHPRDKNVLQLEESFVQRSLVEWLDNVVGQNVSRARVEVGVHGRLELSRRNVILGSDVADGLPFFGHLAHDCSSSAGSSVQDGQEHRHVNVHVIVRLE